MGLTNQEVKKISYKEGNGFYFVLWIFAGIYILSIACTFLIRASIDLGLVGIVLLEFVVPYGMAELIVYLKKRGQNFTFIIGKRESKIKKRRNWFYLSKL
ncbi:hypothetical protein [Faecalibacillus intestinalis]|uniref:hypothetical protein n=1 Tax=Faecalibacillus intestinalis TaxID=1982626 RepID=UPI0022E64300|nr:hypothetical protein [Faecalibacillus intestinalis]